MLQSEFTNCPLIEIFSHSASSGQPFSKTFRPLLKMVLSTGDQLSAWRAQLVVCVHITTLNFVI